MATTTTERIAMNVEIEHEVLTDNSVVHNVILHIDDDQPHNRVVRIGCMDKKRAQQLAQLLADSSFSELQGD